MSISTIAGYRRKIVNALKSVGIYDPALSVQIDTLASAVRTRAMCDDIIDGLEDVTVVEESRYGTKIVPHPVFKIQRDAQAEITKQLKQLKLTVADVVGTPDQPDAFDALDADIRNIR